MSAQHLIFVDCEAFGGCPATGALTELGAVEYESRQTFHGVLLRSVPNPANPAEPLPSTFFAELQSGRKTCEVRLDDRGYLVGDLLVLREWDPTIQQYVGSDDLRFQVTHIVPLGNLRPPFAVEQWGPYVVLSLRRVGAIQLEHECERCRDLEEPPPRGRG